MLRNLILPYTCRFQQWKVHIPSLENDFWQNLQFPGYLYDSCKYLYPLDMKLALLHACIPEEQWNIFRNCSYSNAAVNGHLELTLKGRYRFDAISTLNLEVYKFWDRWIFTYFFFGHDESSPNYFWRHGESWTYVHSIVLLFSLFESESWPRKNKSAWWIFTQLYFCGGEILTQLFWKRDGLMVNPYLMILLKRWTEVKTWGGWVQDALWCMHK